jgi:hypothetical protein
MSSASDTRRGERYSRQTLSGGRREAAGYVFQSTPRCHVTPEFILIVSILVGIVAVVLILLSRSDRNT